VYVCVWAHFRGGPKCLAHAALSRLQLGSLWCTHTRIVRNTYDIQFKYAGDLPNGLAWARFFATVACLTITAATLAVALVILVLPGPSHSVAPWWTARIGYCIALVSALFTYAIFASCDETVAKSCASGTGSALNAVNVLVLTGLIVLTFWIEVPDEPLTNVYNRFFPPTPRGRSSTATPTRRSAGHGGEAGHRSKSRGGGSGHHRSKSRGGGETGRSKSRSRRADLPTGAVSSTQTDPTTSQTEIPMATVLTTVAADDDSPLARRIEQRNTTASEVEFDVSTLHTDVEFEK
jgi:hypothetical protein